MTNPDKTVISASPKDCNKSRQEQERVSKKRQGEINQIDYRHKYLYRHRVVRCQYETRVLCGIAWSLSRTSSPTLVKDLLKLKMKMSSLTVYQWKVH